MVRLRSTFYKVFKVAGGGWQQGNIMPAAEFAFDGVQIFLTYPQCALEREQLRDILVERTDPSKYLVARELHIDGNYHLHAYLHFGRRRRFVGTAVFDVDGHHPNIQRPRSARSVIAYCSKEDTELLANFDHTEGEANDNWGTLLERSSSKAEFLEAVRCRFPRDYVLNLERLLFFCEWRFGRDECEYSGRGRCDFVELPTMKDWVEANLLQVRKWFRGAPVPSLPWVGLYPLMPILAKFLRKWSDRARSYLLELLGSGRLSGQDLLARPCTSVDSSTWMTGTTELYMPSSTTSTGSTFPIGNRGSDVKSNSPLLTSTERNEPSSGENQASSSETTMTLILQELFPELNMNGLWQIV